MLKFTSLLILLLQLSGLCAQHATSIHGVVILDQTGEPLHGASIVYFEKGKSHFIISNQAGGFFLNTAAAIDSMQVSMIGHESVTYFRPALKAGTITVKMKVAAASLNEVVVKPPGALEIIEQAILATRSMLPRSGFENNFFYREVISDSAGFLSVSEAIFNTQYQPPQGSSKLRLIRGRSKEDVNYSRLFEDFHPGGGPQSLAENYFTVAFPDFLNTKKLKLFEFKRLGTIRFGERLLYVISFDQKPTVKESLEKGKIFIDQEDFSIIRYEAENSERGMPYLKSLVGTDKVFAAILNIELKKKSWKREVVFNKVNGNLVLSHANSSHSISYKQPKKDLDLDLTITSELAVTDQLMPASAPMKKEEEWKRKHLVSNLPGDFDPGFWGGYSTISPTAEVDKIIGVIGRKNNEQSIDRLKGNWEYVGRDFFVAYQREDRISLVPIMKAAWEDDETAGMLYKPMDGDFTIETKLVLTKRTDSTLLPDNGFQQAGIILRDPAGNQEQSIVLAIGTGGNGQAKYFLRNTINGKSKGPVDKIEGLDHHLRFIKKGSECSAWIRSGAGQEWKMIATYHAAFLSRRVQAGMMVMARFAGSGPKAKPDMKANFLAFTINKN